MEGNKRILVMVLCSRNYLSKISSDAQQNIWRKYKQKYEIIHFVGKNDDSSRELNYINDSNKNYLIINTDDGYSNIARKTLLALEEAYQNHKFDYIFRTNTSSYINFNKLDKFIHNNQNTLSYSGKIVTTAEGDDIASGAGFFLSNKNVELILSNKNLYEDILPDDVAIARILKKFNIYPDDSTRMDLKQIPHPNKIYTSKDFHYRCRLDPRYHRILEPMLIRYLEIATNNKNLTVLINYYILRLIFFITNLKLIRKFLQKYYSYKFYGEVHIRNKLIYSKK